MLGPWLRPCFRSRGQRRRWRQRSPRYGQLIQSYERVWGITCLLSTTCSDRGPRRASVPPGFGNRSQESASRRRHRKWACRSGEGCPSTPTSARSWTDLRSEPVHKSPQGIRKEFSLPARISAQPAFLCRFAPHFEHPPASVIETHEAFECCPDAAGEVRLEGTRSSCERLAAAACWSGRKDSTDACPRRTPTVQSVRFHALIHPLCSRESDQTTPAKPFGVRRSLPCARRPTSGCELSRCPRPHPSWAVSPNDWGRSHPYPLAYRLSMLRSQDSCRCVIAPSTALVLGDCSEVVSTP